MIGCGNPFWAFTTHLNLISWIRGFSYLYTLEQLGVSDFSFFDFVVEDV